MKYASFTIVNFLGKGHNSQMAQFQDSGDGGTVPADLQQSWNRSAEQLFSSALSRPDIYQRVTTLIGKTAAMLRDRHAGAIELIAAAQSPDDLLSDVMAGDDRLSLDELDPFGLVGAACAMRYREVVEESAALTRRDALATADPDQWVVLVESGPPAGDVFVSYRRLEAHRNSGLALAIATRPDNDFTGCVHSIDILRIDIGSGALLGPPDGMESSVEYSTAAAREEGVERIKSELVSGDS